MRNADASWTSPFGMEAAATHRHIALSTAFFVNVEKIECTRSKGQAL